MSSLTTGGSSMEAEQYYSMSAEEAGTHLSLGIGAGGAGGAKNLRLAPRTVQLFGQVLSVQDDDGHGDGAQAFHHRGRPTGAAPVSRSRKKKKDAAAATGDATATAADSDRYQNQSKKAKIAWRDEVGGGGGGRKKLRLTAAQATMLEDSFRAHNILSHGEKQELARRVGLSTRQVEVWFQNRRARTKLKLTEVDCDLLRRLCDRLANDNARLRRDLADLRRAAAASSTSLANAVCVSCGGGAEISSSSRSPLSPPAAATGWRSSK